MKRNIFKKEELFNKKQKKEDNNQNNQEMGFLGWLALIFIVLKLTGYISWPWVWVLAPIWGSFVFALLILIIIIVSSHN